MAGKAKARTQIIRLISTAQTGFFYTTQRLRTGPKLSAVKYDPLGACSLPCLCLQCLRRPCSEAAGPLRGEQKDEEGLIRRTLSISVAAIYTLGSENNANHVHLDCPSFLAGFSPSQQLFGYPFVAHPAPSTQELSAIATLAASGRMATYDALMTRGDARPSDARKTNFAALHGKHDGMLPSSASVIVPPVPAVVPAVHATDVHPVPIVPVVPIIALVIPDSVAVPLDSAAPVVPAVAANVPAPVLSADDGAIDRRVAAAHARVVPADTRTRERLNTRSLPCTPHGQGGWGEYLRVIRPQIERAVRVVHGRRCGHRRAG
ncbi:hypothetical protein EYR38_006285 [Pleurotus pulmonarius]|nr:hypothetical protein EYR38_006285 [Pleurotus pulmonarius]